MKIPLRFKDKVLAFISELRKISDSALQNVTEISKGSGSETDFPLPYV